MYNKIIIATKNKGKLSEIKKLLSGLNIEVLSQDEAGVFDDVIEDGTTFCENAYKKAHFIMKKTNLPTFADDSGLEVECLSGAPGIYSARYAGENATDSMKIEKLLNEMDKEESRAARFVCAICLVLPNENKYFFEGICSGEILKSPRGNGGFGYDPVFFVSEYNKTFSQLDIEIKNKISHRAKAINLLIKKIKEIF